MRGRRVDFYPAFPHDDKGRPGDYCKLPPEVADVYPGCEWVWLAVDPTGGALAITPKHHTVEEHDDGTITVSPSIVAPSGWHGFLRAGTWS